MMQFLVDRIQDPNHFTIIQCSSNLSSLEISVGLLTGLVSMFFFFEKTNNSLIITQFNIIHIFCTYSFKKDRQSQIKISLNNSN